MWDACRAFARMDVVDTVPNVTPADHMAAAVKMRAHLDNDCTRSPCAVCSCYCRVVDLLTVSPSECPGLHLLVADGPKTPEFPRDALTTTTIANRLYCIQAAGCIMDPDNTTVITMHVCKECSDQLGKNHVPKKSLVAFDTGGLRVSKRP
jgi:hypothetical protein